MIYVALVLLVLTNVISFVRDISLYKLYNECKNALKYNDAKHTANYFTQLKTNCAILEEFASLSKRIEKLEKSSKTKRAQKGGTK